MGTEGAEGDGLRCRDFPQRQREVSGGIQHRGRMCVRMCEQVCV